MPSNESEAKNKELFLELLYRRERDGLLRYVSVILRKCGSGHASVADRAEDVVQELFYLAWEKADILFESESPVGWLYNAAKLKVHESLREERKWIKHLTLSTSGSGKGQPTRIPVEWTCLMSPEEYELMHKL